jgi:glucose-6-phosphate dehydrogenase assembly protein OpcA
MAAALEAWTGRDVSVADIERQLAALRATADLSGDGLPDLRTSVLTHMAWVPAEWEAPATDTLAGLQERHPSRTLLLLPQPDAPDGLDAEVSVRCFALRGQEHHVCSEVVELRLRGGRAEVAASVVTPLLIADLPVFLRWRGRPDFGRDMLRGLLHVADRLVVDSREWPDVPSAYAAFAGTFDLVAASDVAWARTLGWRRRLAELWPREYRTLRVLGPAADAHLLAGWLRSRLGRGVELEHDERDDVEAVFVDGDAVPAPRGRRPTPSDLLSAELDRFSRDRVYEAAVRGTVP